MDLSLERDSSVIGSLFQQIIADMKNTSPLWEDFVAKASKLHACLRAAIQAIAAYLDAFQKIADAATNSRGASKEIGTALTRVCLRHKAVETRMKTFTTAIMDCLIIPLQDKLEDWKRQVATIDKEHAKEYKRCRTELKKRSSDTLRLQKKARKGQSDTIQSLVDSHMQDVTMRRAELEEVERKSLRAAMIEERMRYCSFVNMLQPVVKEECEVMSELGHLQEAMQSIANVTKEPNVLPQSSEELILESKSTINLYPESPGGNSGSQGCSNSLGSRKSSVCSISSMNSSGSSGSPGHHHYQRSLSQLLTPAIRLKPGESSDSGFCSSPALTSQASTNTSQSHAISTWPPHSQDVVQTNDRPHTISSAYEKGHQRPALTVYTFQNPETIMESQKSPAQMACRPPLPVRCSSLERPLSSTGARNSNVNLMQRQCPSPIPAHITKELPQLQPTYVNMSELASMAASKITNQQLQQQQQLMQQQSKTQQHHQQQINSTAPFDSSSIVISQQQQQQTAGSPDQSSSAGNTENSSATITTTATAGTTPPSSGGSPLSSLSQNNSPQLTNNTNSPQTPVNSNSGIAVGGNNTNSSNTPTTTANTTPTSVTGTTATPTSSTGDELKITETDNAINNPNDSNNSVLSTPLENDEKSRGSVLEKRSLFEKLEEKQAMNNNPPILPSVVKNSQTPSNSETSLFVNRKEEIYKATGTNEKDPDQIYEDSIQELNNLIGELDSFQREHEMKEKAANSQQQDQRQPNSDKKNYDQQTSIDTDSDKISIGSLNYSTQSTNASEQKFNYSDSEVSRYMSETGSGSVGFENPTFAHFNNSNEKMNDVVDGGVHLIPYDSNYVITPDVDYLRQNSEIVVLRCKDATTPDGTSVSEPKQRLSSFRYDPQTGQQQQSHYHSQSDLQQMKKEQQQLREQQQQHQQHSNHYDQGTDNRDDCSVNNLNGIDRSPLIVDTNVSCVNDFKANLDERLRTKPVVSPRPASLSGCVSRITRRSSVNTTKPPPPVRRSSSVTPSHNAATPNSPNLLQQNVMNTSAESLPPPPAFLLDRNTVNASPVTVNVAETVKALTVIRHTPASPSALRRAQAQMNQVQTVQNNTHMNNNTSSSSSTTPNLCSTPKNEAPPPPISPVYAPQIQNSNSVTNSVSSDSFNSQFRTQNSGIYAQPKQVTKMSSFRTPSPGPQKASSGLLAQLNARLAPNKHSQQQQQQQQQQSHHHHQSSSNDYSLYQQQQQQQQQPIYQDSRSQSQYGQRHEYSNSGQNSPLHHGYCTQPEQIYSRAGDRYYYSGAQQQQTPPNQQQQYHHHHQQSSQQYDDFSPSNNDKTGSIRSKTKAEFLENLNAKLAKQGLSGRAFAVRNLINSKALPDPRLCHESLMDQIKRGATLKRNRTINDRSAPKIH